MERKIEMKIRYFIKGKTETSKLYQNGIVNAKNPEKTPKHESHRNEREKEQNSTP
jgi:hypothetical protein